MNGLVRTQLSAMMFAQYFIWGAWFVTLGTYMGSMPGFNAGHIGAAYGMQGIGAILAPLFIGAIADRLFPAQMVMGILHLLGAGVMYWASTVTDPQVFVYAILAYFLCYMPTLPLTNAISFNAMTDTERQFPAVRVLGTVGWIVAGVAVGSIAGAAQTNLPMLIAASGSLALGLFSFILPNTPPQGKGQKLNLLSLFGLDIMGSVKEASFWIFIVCSTLIVVPLSFYYAFTNPFLAEAGATVTIGGQTFEPTAIMTLGQVSEILFMLLLPFFFARFGIKWVLVIGMLAWVARYVLFAFGVNDLGPIMPMLLLGILLHGICYDFFFVAGQIYVDKKFAPGERSRAQSFLALMTLGLGQTIGSNLAGQWVARHTFGDGASRDWTAIWLLPAGLALVVTMLFLFLFRARTAPKIA